MVFGDRSGQDAAPGGDIHPAIGKPRPYHRTRFVMGSSERRMCAASTNQSNISGSCLCGTVCFEINGSFDSFFLCRCSRCRKGSGTAHGANLFASGATLHWLAGEAEVKIFKLPGTRHQRSFCMECGSALPDVQMDGAMLQVPAGCLDGPIWIRPTAHICCASRADWDVALDEIIMMNGPPG
ncbi:GFA family protein [Sphingomonas sp. RP10(2022)]|uniref:GFA family protein n=1 Tax=Sphingomonas liriopis TaxID=2949094 RepID=A0A9X2HTQ2_9SPHN|nr:GFA family protein [Sphingomonas liriopis]MCP3733324.1 GFA family protein [Sphingomonas liriopis]